MLFRRLYYLLKPFAPLSLRRALRRLHAQSLAQSSHHLWPIDPSAFRSPPHFSGWPDHHPFAFVLTHDVETQRGLDRVQQLAELEMLHGFRSSFNFIPEGPYQVPDSLRHWLTSHGFEVGVHDLHHDGKLYSSKKQFLKKAARINHYLHAWNAVGFRSGFMLRNLDWFHHLHITYDASTFDTDPFEPQPDAAKTIFPFWVPSPIPQNRYLELPYTLPQDSTLFLVKEASTIDIWKEKLAWIATHHGMALVNIHPDYIQFPHDSPTPETYPLQHVTDLLTHLRSQFTPPPWNPTPRDLTTWFTQSNPHPPHTLARKRVAVLLYSYYPADPRPRRAAEALAEVGMQVDLFCLRENDSQPTREVINGVSVYRTPIQRQRHSKLTYLKQYAQFIATCSYFLSKSVFREKYHLVHVHNMPDVLVFASLLPKLSGAKIILDLHDPMPELMMSIYQFPTHHWLVNSLRFLERSSIRFAHLVLTPNLAFQHLFNSRSATPGKVHILMNSPESHRIIHHGSIVHRHGIDLLVEAVALLLPHIPNLHLDLYGAHTPFTDTLLTLASQLGIADHVHYHGPKSQSEIADAIRSSHLGVIPNRLSPFTELNFPTRIFEYLAMHRPVITPDTTGIRDYFPDGGVIPFTPDNLPDLVEKILWVKNHPDLAALTVEKGREIYRNHLWANEKSRFIQLVTSLLTPSPLEN
ncbi:MAG: glycosyltransferase [Verrucomicrobia bacterium]|nr:glycosyltransferase [Verrucomicrobiota bacterium]